nr:unnamed protein product [Callosobruchus analis]
MYCQIQLDNYNGTYHPGKSIKGRVVCTFDADADIKGKIKHFRAVFLIKCRRSTYILTLVIGLLNKKRERDYGAAKCQN